MKNSIRRSLIVMVITIVHVTSNGQNTYDHWQQSILAKTGLPSTDSLSIVSVQSDEIGMTHVKLQQYHRGIKVLGGEVIAHFGNGLLTSVQDYSIKAIKLEKSHATSFARKSGLSEDHYLVQTAEGAPLHISECISKNGQLDFVDVSDGNVLLSVPVNRGINTPGKAITRYHGEVDITTCKELDVFILQEQRNGVLIRTLDAGNQTIEQFTQNFNQPPLFDTLANFEDDDNLWDLRNERFDEIATDIHWASEVTFDYFLDKHQRNSIDHEGGEITSIVHLGEDWDEAFYLAPPFNFMGYGDGGPLGPNATLDVVAHEMAHAVVFYSARLLYVGETAALDEGFADIFGTAVKFYREVSALKNPWLLAEQLGGFRDISNPKAKGQPDTYKGEYWYEGPERTLFAHINNGPIIYWFYLLSEGGSGVTDFGENFSINALGIEKAEKIAYRTLNYYLHTVAQFTDARTGSIRATADLFGEDSEEFKQVKKAWDAVGVRDQVVTSISESYTAPKPALFPNPVGPGQKITVHSYGISQSFDEPAPALYSMTGQEINISHRTAMQGQGVFSLDLTGLRSGIYLLTMKGHSPVRIYKQ